jgi:serine/threonine protein kinase
MSLKKLGRYDLVRVLGKGAMGLVYEGRDPNLDRRVAIKTIKVENLSDESAAEYEVRFRTEARSAARLQHPNIVSVYDSDRDGDIAFLVMEFIQGDDLKHHLDKGDLYTLEQSQRIMADLLSALDYAHRQNIVHRDIKPANLLIEPDGRVKLADFGVARIQDSGEATRTQGTIVGTLKYMSPEQLQGRPIDSRADIYAAGVVLYQLLTGKRPFDGDTDFAVIQQIVNYTPPAATYFNDRLPPAIDAVVAKALAKSRDQRYSTAQEFSNALAAACRDASDITAVPPAAVPGKGSSSTWTATLLAGESLVSTNSGTGGTGTSATSSSIVTQELELVYWKDIKESVDVEDIQGFLAKFPSGIYADLARRRLKKLGVSGDESDVGTRSGTVTQLSVPSTSQLEKTVLQARPADAADKTADKTDLAWQALEAAAAQTPSLPLGQAMPPAVTEADPDATRLGTTAPAPVRAEVASAPAPATAQAVPAVTPAKPKTALFAGVAIAVLAVAGMAFKLMSPSAPVDPAAAALLAASAPGTAASAPESAASAASAAAASPAPQASSPQAAASAQAAARAAAAKKAAAEKEKEKDKAAKPAPTKAASTAAPAASSSAERPATPAPSAAATPQQACEGRMLLGYQTCMSEQCAKPAFASAAICVERRAIEQRREAERHSR